MTDMVQFLTWLASAGGAAATLSFILERIPQFQDLDSNYKSWVNLGGTIVLALSAFAVLTYVPAATLALLAPWFKVVAACVVAWLASQVAHTVDPARIQKASDASLALPVVPPAVPVVPSTPPVTPPVAPMGPPSAPKA